MRTLLTCLLIALPFSAAAQQAKPIHLEELTWPELQTRIRSGDTTIIIPTGGTEQNGPHLTLGKHNYIVKYTAERIARQLGNAIVAPVIEYVPEGSINPPQGNMAWPGTISIRDDIFYGLLADTAASMRQAGFTLICFLGDSGGNQNIQAFVERDLNRQWRNQGATIMQVNSYYDNKAAEIWAKEQKLGGDTPQAHGGFMDTSELLAVQPRAVRKNIIASGTATLTQNMGVMGDPSQAKAAYGKKLLAIRIDAAVGQIKRMQKILAASKDSRRRR